MRTAHLFAGVGGGMLADLILGHTPVLAVEQDPYCCDVLRDRSEDGWFPGLEVAECDIRTFDFEPWRGGVDCIAAGFPCQDISAAGRGAGISGERSGLFFEVVRAIDAIRPRYIFLENSPLIRTRGRDVVIRELVARGYSWRDGKIGAADVGAPHQRDRWFLLAADGDSLRELESQRRECEERRRDSDGAEQNADADGNRAVRRTHSAGARSNVGRRPGDGAQVSGGHKGSGETIADADGEFLRQQSGRRSGSDGQKAQESCGNVADSDGCGRREKQHQHEGQSRDGELFPDGANCTTADVNSAGRGTGRCETARQLQSRLASEACATADALRVGLQESIQRGGLQEAEAETIEAVARHTGAYNWAPAYSYGGGVVHGLSAKSHRVKALGNAQVPLQAAAAWLALSGGQL